VVVVVGSHLGPLPLPAQQRRLWPQDGVHVTDNIYSRLQCPQMWVGGEGGAGRGSSVRLCSRTSGGGGPAREAGGKNSPAGLPILGALSQAGPGLGSRSYSGA
jgi:hypothetical protein